MTTGVTPRRPFRALVGLACLLPPWLRAAGPQFWRIEGAADGAGLGIGAEAVEEQLEEVRDGCRVCRAREFRIARSAEERDLLWKGRKNAFGAIGRVSPTYYVQDGVVPRTQVPAILRKIGEIAEKYDVRIANVFHAGDGNLHPLVLFDQRDKAELERVDKAMDEIVDYALSVGGTLSGEHGIGIGKRKFMAQQHGPAVAVMRQIKTLFDPNGILNPGKIFF